MTNQPNATSASAEVSKAHVQELVARGRSEYRVFELIDALDPDETGTRAIREATIEIVEINAASDLKAGVPICQTASTLLSSEGLDAPAMFDAWRRCLVASQHDRKAMKPLCSDFVAVMHALSSKVLLESIDFVVELIEHHKRDALAMIRSSLGERIHLLEADVRKQCLDFLMKYVPVTYPKPLEGLVHIIAHLIENGEQDLVDTLASICTPESVGKDRAVEPFLEKCGVTLRALASDLHLPYLRLSIRVAGQSLGSASSLATSLPKRLTAIDRDAQVQYLCAFERIVQHASIRAVSFCLRSLDKLFSPRPAASTLALVDLICAVGEAYGPSAASDFIAKKTPASKQAWGNA